MKTASLVLTFILTVVHGAAAQPQKDRASVPDKYKWDLSQIYPTDAAWRAAKDKVAADIPKITAFKGTLASSAARLAEALEVTNSVSKEFARAYVYASMKADEDIRVASYQGNVQEMQQLGASFGAQAAFIEPEILKAGSDTINKFIASEPKLAIYAQSLRDTLRRSDHTLSEPEERLLAQSSLLQASPSDVYNILSNADFPYPTVTLSDGKSVKLDSASFSLYRGVPNRQDREKVMSAFFNALGSFRGTFGSTLNGQVQGDLFTAKARKYPTALAASLDGPNIPVTVYTGLVEGVNRNLPTFHRYLNLRKKMMGLPDLHYYDLYAPLVGAVDTNYTPDEAEKNTMAALAPLGPEYAAAAKRAFSERWIDMYPTQGKASGAYSNGGAYDVHPYMLINYNGKYADVSTMAHELGPHDAQLPVEQDAALSHGQLRDVRRRSRVHVQRSAADRLHAEADQRRRGAAVTARELPREDQGHRLPSDAVRRVRAAGARDGGEGRADHRRRAVKLYLEITKKYYGHDKGICVVDDYVAHEWSYIPHFYRNFYVFQYATSFTASSALSEKVMAGDPAATKRYLAFLSRRRIEVPDRSSQGRRRRHDDPGAAGVDDARR